MRLAHRYRCIPLWILLAFPAIGIGQSYSCTMELPYVQDFNSFTYQTPHAGSAVDMTLVSEDICWTQYIYRSNYTVCSMISPNHTGSGNHALWMFAHHPMAGQSDRVEYTYTVSPAFRDPPTVISFDVQYQWFDSAGYFGTPDGLPWHAGILQLGYVTNDFDLEDSYFAIANIVIDTAAWFSGNTENTDHWQHYRLDLRTRYTTLPTIRHMAFKPNCNMDSLQTVHIYIDNLRVADEMDTVDYHDTVCQSRPYSGYGFAVDSTETATAGVHTFSREVLESEGMVFYRLSLWVEEPVTTYIDTTLAYGDTLWFLDSLIVNTGNYVFLLSSAHGCDSTVVLSVRAEEVGLLSSAQKICSGEEIILTASGTVSFRWASVPADPVLASLQGRNPIAVHPQVNTVYQLLDTGGAVLAAVEIESEPCEGLWFPNVFTPDAESNNRFTVQTTYPVESFEMTIYTRNGLLVWHTEDINQMWDGTRNGTSMPQGAYVYHWRLKSNNRVRSGLGTMTLLR